MLSDLPLVEKVYLMGHFAWAVFIAVISSSAYNCNFVQYCKVHSYLFPRVTITPFSVENWSEGKPYEETNYKNIRNICLVFTENLAVVHSYVRYVLPECSTDEQLLVLLKSQQMKTLVYMPLSVREPKNNNETNFSLFFFNLKNIGQYTIEVFINYH